MTGNGTKGRIMPALSGGMKKLKWIDDEARSPKGQRSLRLKSETPTGTCASKTTAQCI
jgi:hypothetical protein